ncbi:MAG: sugar ABC transporter substrate-binding protein [Mycobacterium sp.]
MRRLEIARRLGAVGAVVGVAASLVSACASSPGTDASGAECKREYTIGFSHPVGEAAFVKTLKKQVEEQAEKIGCVSVLMDNTQANDLQSQRAALETWVTQRVDAIVVLPVDASSLENLKKSAQAKGIKWLTYAAPGEGTDGFTGFNNAAAGKAVGDAAAEFIKERNLAGKVVAAVTTLSPLPDVAGRWKEPIKAINGAGVEIVSEQDCGDETCGLQIAETLLRQHPNLRVFVGMNDDAALGAAKAFANAGIDPSEVFIGGQDGSLEALKAVKAGGAYRISAAIDMPELAHAVVQNPINAVNGTGETSTEAPIVPATLKDPKKLDELIEQMSAG